jgi:DNA repair protein RecO (recombination protein O)
MPTDQAEAIVLRTSNVGDQDKIAVFFCREKGIVRGVAKGARKFGNRFGSSLEPLSVVHVFYYEKERRELVTVSGCDLIESFFEIQAEPATAFLLTYFGELVEEFAPARAREEVLYRLLLSVLRCLKEGGVREMPQAAQPRLARPQEGRRVLPGLRPGQEGRSATRDPGLPPLGPQEPAARRLRPAFQRRPGRRDPEDAPGPDRLPYGTGAAEPAFPQDEVTPICYNWGNKIDARTVI